MAKQNENTKKASAAVFKAKLIRGAKLSVDYETNTAEGGVVQLVSSYEEMDGDANMVITAPVQGEVPYPFHKGERISLSFADRTALYSFDAAILERFRQDGIALTRIEIKGEVRRMQRRQDFRLPVSMQSVMERIDASTGESKGYVIHISDLSGGGVGIQSHLPLEHGEEVFVYIPKGGKPERIKTEVCRCAPNERIGSPYEFAIGLKFLFNSPKEKEAMVAHVFRLEREQRKRI